MRRFLESVPLFRAVPAGELQRICDASTTHRFRRGEVIFEEGHLAEAVWIVVRGWVHLVKQTPSGGTATIFTMTPDEALCGVSAFEHGTYSAGAIAATNTQVVRIPADRFADLLATKPAFVRDVLLICCARMRHMADTISLAQSPVQQRVVSTLLRLQSSFGNTIPITHQELAQMAGTRLETSIRTLGTLRRKGWLTTARGKITLHHLDQLRSLLQINGFHATPN